MTTQGNSNLHNPHLDGDSFFLPGGSVGVLLFHGFTATAAEVRLLAEILHRKGYTVSGPLLPGHGTHPDDLNRTRWQEWAQAGQRALDHLSQTCQSVWLGGESMGGVLALYLAAHNPQTRGLLLYAPALVLTMSWLDRLKLTLAAPFLAQVGRARLDNADTWQGYPGLPLKGVIQLLRFQQAVLPLLPRIHQPVLVLQARFDATVSPQAGSVILQGVSSTRKELFWLEKSYHTILLGAELERAAALTLEFIEKT